MKRTLIHILLLTFLAGVAHGQSLKAFLNAAEDAMSEKDYFSAGHYYKTALEFDSTDLDIRYKYAEAYRLYNAFSVAERGYQMVVDSSTHAAHPLASYYLAETQHRLGKYDKARDNYELYISESDDEFRKAKAEKEIIAINWAQNKEANPAKGIEVDTLRNGENTRHSEFSPVKIDSQLYYSSHRFVLEKDDEKVSKFYSNILKSDEKSSRVLLNDSFKENGPYIGGIAFNTDRSKIYYTVCSYVNSFDITCDIYTRPIDENGNWGEGMKLPSTINDTSSTNTQPSVGYDINIDKEILYFVSDREEGSKGGFDIWYSVIQDEDYGTPVNLEELNTNADDITPFFHSPTSTLYYSSNGRPNSDNVMGGHDIYMSQKRESGYDVPVNLEYPRNTTLDDIYYSLNPEGTEAFLSSNRLGSKNMVEGYEDCCFDIYKVEIEEVLTKLKILTFHEITGEPLIETRVRIIDPISSDTLFDSLNPGAHEHEFDLKCGREFIMLVEKSGYESVETNLRSSDCNDLEEIVKKIYLSPQRVRLDVFTFDEKTRESLNGVTVTLIDLSDPESKPIIVADLSRNFYTFDIIAGGNYELVAKKSGYETVSLIVNSNLIINGIVTEKLYLPRRTLDPYLPVIVYFDNDSPNPRSIKMYTDSIYSDTYNKYVVKKEAFMDLYTASLSGEAVEEGKTAVKNFFENEVEFGYERLVTFITQLHLRLEAGDIIELSLKGFASPRAANKYNLALGQRRIWTLKNEIREFGGGLLKSYIESGKLKIVEISFGEEVAPAGISDSYENRRLSVYSVEASRERKAEIVRVRILN